MDRLIRACLAVWLVIGVSCGLVVLHGAVSHPATVTYESSRYGYAVTVPSDWTITAAAADWVVIKPWDQTPSADVLAEGDLRFTVVATEPIGSRSLTEWARAFVPERPDLREPLTFPHCVAAGGWTMPVPGYRGWESVRVAGHAAIIRVACGHVDAVVAVGRRTYVLSMFTGFQPLADLTAFDAVVRTMRFGSAAAGTGRIEPDGHARAST